MAFAFRRFNDEVKHIKVIEKDSWIHITEAKKFESLLVGGSTARPFILAQQICTGSLRVNSFVPPSVVVVVSFLFSPP